MQIIVPYSASANGTSVSPRRFSGSIQPQLSPDTVTIGSRGRGLGVVAAAGMAALALTGCGRSAQVTVPQLPPGEYKVSHQVARDGGSFNNWGKTTDACMFAAPDGNYTVFHSTSTEGWTMRTIVVPSGQTFLVDAAGISPDYQRINRTDNDIVGHIDTLEKIAGACQQTESNDTTIHTTVTIK